MILENVLPTSFVGDESLERRQTTSITIILMFLVRRKIHVRRFLRIKLGKRYIKASPRSFITSSVLFPQTSFFY